jgi:hypothetical protein
VSVPTSNWIAEVFLIKGKGGPFRLPQVVTGRTHSCLRSGVARKGKSVPTPQRFSPLGHQKVETRSAPSASDNPRAASPTNSQKAATRYLFSLRKTKWTRSLLPGPTLAPAMAGGSRQGGVKFVEHDAAGLPVKRKQVHQACLPCRKRKVILQIHSLQQCSGPNPTRNAATTSKAQAHQKIRTMPIPPRKHGPGALQPMPPTPSQTETLPMPPLNCSASFITRRTTHRAPVPIMSRQSKPHRPRHFWAT